MSRRDAYPAGVPCFVDTLTADVEAAKGFYGGIFGWEFAGPGPMPGDPPGAYFVARVGGDDVAGVGTLPAQSAGAVPPAWNTHVAVDSADEAAARATAAGGSVLVKAFDAPPAGRMAVIADPAGGVLTVWEAGDRAGAARVNEPSAWAMSLLTTPDPDAAKAFYGELFGWEADAFGPVWLFRLPGYVGGEPAQPVPRDVIAAMRRGRIRPCGLGRRLLDRRCRRRRGGRARPGRSRRRRARRAGELPPRGPGRSRRGDVLSQPAAAQWMSRGRRESDSRQHSAAVTAETTITDGHAPITRPSRCEAAKAISPVAVSVAVTRVPSRRAHTAMQASPQAARTTPPSGREPVPTATPNPATSPAAAIGAVGTRSRRSASRGGLSSSVAIAR